MIPYSTQNISSKDIKSVVNTLKSKFLTQGPMVQNFENAISKYCKVKHAVAVNSATSALHLACKALGLKKNDWLWTSPNTFVASATCGIHCGAKIDFIDIDSETLNISIENLKNKLELAKKKGKLPKIIIPVHFGGRPNDMISIHKLSKIYGFKIIEDASHALGASYKGSKKKFFKVGSCEHSDITIFSFHPVKIITCAEGGILTTNNSKIANKISLLREHGIVKNISKNIIFSRDEIWNYKQIELGYNFRLSDIHASLGLSQLGKVDIFNQKRNAIANIYQKKLTNYPVKLPSIDKNIYSSYHLFPIRIQDTSPKSRAYIYKTMMNNGIGVNIHYIPVYRQPYFKQLGFKKENFPETEKYFKETISIPIFPSLNQKDQNYVIYNLKCLLKKL